MHVHALVDYHNLPRQVRDAGPASLGRLIDAMISSQRLEVREISIRLYGGWYDDQGLSRDGTKLTQEIGGAFPLLLVDVGGKMRHVHCEIASSLVDSRGDLFVSTLRHRHGLDWYVRDPHPVGCIDQANCTIPVVMRWSRRGCPRAGCPVSSFEAFRCYQQKLVDTLICCDLLSLAVIDPATPVFLISEDDDFVPALLLAGVRGAAIWHVRTKAAKIRVYDQMLIQRGVRLASL
jgi:uncharacterized LabA/DUF88 family protein